MRPTPRGRTSVLASLMFLLCTAAGHNRVRAQADPNSDARIFFEQGNRHYQRAVGLGGAARERALEQALAEYVRSLRIVRSRNALFNAGAVLTELDRPAEAYRYLQEYLTIEDLDPSDRSEAQAQLSALRPRVSLVQVTTVPEGASVRIDRLDLAPVGETPLILPLDPGPHRIFLSARGYRSRVIEAEAALGESSDVRVTLEADVVSLRVIAAEGASILMNGQPFAHDRPHELPPGTYSFRIEDAAGVVTDREVEIPVGAQPMEVDFRSDAAHGRYVLESNVDGVLSVDGDRVSRGRSANLRLSEGPHRIDFSADGYVPFQDSLVTQRGVQTFIQIEMAIDDTHRRFGSVPVWTLLGTSVLGATTLGLGLHALNLNRNYDDNPTENGFDRVERANLVTDAFLGLTIASAVTTLLLFLLNKEIAPEDSRATYSQSELRDQGGQTTFARAGER